MEYKVCHQSELEEKKPYAVNVKDKAIGIIRVDDQLYAYENVCPHFGGPVCLGGVFGKISLELDECKRVIKEVVSEDVLHLVCPWHGFEYDLKTGICVFDPKYRLRQVEVFMRDGYVFVNVD